MSSTSKLASSDFPRFGDFVIMPNHVHVLITPMHDDALEDLLQQMKASADHAGHPLEIKWADFCQMRTIL
ncbi:MAG: hypothetical protein KDN22_14590 [Verrucomicrobiae bacterium]|nr:hypothetical protein [Verrucomicrobiae bacterium]